MQKKQPKNKPKKQRQAEVFKSKYKIDIENLLKVDTVQLLLKLIGIRSEFNSIEISVPSTFCLYKVIEIINEYHNYSLNDVRLYLGDETRPLDEYLNKSLLEIGLVRSEVILICYKYSPVKCPLLLSGYY